MKYARVVLLMNFMSAKYDAGHYQDFENWGMIEVCKEFIEKKQIQLFWYAFHSQNIIIKKIHTRNIYLVWMPLMSNLCSEKITILVTVLGDKGNILLLYIHNTIQY